MNIACKAIVSKIICLYCNDPVFSYEYNQELENYTMYYLMQIMYIIFQNKF